VKELKDAYTKVGQSSLEGKIERFGVCLIYFGINGHRDIPADVKPNLDKLGVIK
jgi:hypothetical protein